MAPRPARREPAVTWSGISTKTLPITAQSPETMGATLGRLEQTVDLLEQRGYALPPTRLAQLCLGGTIPLERLQVALALSERVDVHEGLVVSRGLADSVPALRDRASSHLLVAGAYWQLALEFVRTLVRWCPYLLSVSVAGSLASGGFKASDDVDLNLIVEDGHRHIAYVALNVLGIAHALRHRAKPVDTHSDRPIASRFMTANLILERSECFPLVRQDPAMAYEFLASEPVHGIGFWRSVIRANPGLSHHFPQLLEHSARLEVSQGPGLPGWLFPAVFDGPAWWVGRLSWRYMQWTRRKRPEALARVAFVRRTMRPYALFEEQ